MQLSKYIFFAKKNKSFLPLEAGIAKVEVLGLPLSYFFPVAVMNKMTREAAVKIPRTDISLIKSSLACSVVIMSKTNKMAVIANKITAKTTKTLRVVNAFFNINWPSYLINHFAY